MNKMAQITYDDKVALNENTSVAEINKLTDDNMNEIKNTINTNTPPTNTSGWSNSLVARNTGGGQSHNNLQPYIVMNYIISY